MEVGEKEAVKKKAAKMEAGKREAVKKKAAKRKIGKCGSLWSVLLSLS